jgi:hypothetical protein
VASAISHDRHLLFIHIPKTGGSSISFSYTDVFDIPDPVVDTHRRIDDFNVCPMDYWKFCVVRNPWAMVASWYCWHLRRANMPVQTMDIAVSHVQPPEVWELDRMDDILRFEHLGEEVERLMTEFGVPIRNLKKLNASGMGDYRQYYSDGQAERVAQRFVRSIKRFGYEF